MRGLDELIPKEGIPRIRIECFFARGVVSLAGGGIVLELDEALLSLRSPFPFVAAEDMVRTASCAWARCELRPRLYSTSIVVQNVFVCSAGGS